MGGGWLTPRLGRFTPGNETWYLSIGGKVGPKAGLDGCGKSRAHQDSIPLIIKSVASHYTD